MSTSETLEEFYQRKFNTPAEGILNKVRHFNVFRREDVTGHGKIPVAYNRRDFYKISLIRGRNIYHYADKSIEISGTTLMFFNPQVPYSWESLSEDRSGYFCIFTESFFTEKIKTQLKEWPMFNPGGHPAYCLDENSETAVNAIFEKMLLEVNSDYVNKFDLLMNYAMEIFHFALKSKPSDKLYQSSNANSRITSVFIDLLERQFPIEHIDQRFALRSANDFASHLAVHVNHLNRAIKETTGRTTTQFISERLASEAKVLLKHKDWNISEIAYCLGFEQATHFNNFFKKQTGMPPSIFRGI